MARHGARPRAALFTTTVTRDEIFHGLHLLPDGSRTSVLDTAVMRCLRRILQAGFSVTDFVELVLPELRRHGFFREDYRGRRLPENLGLGRPKSRHSPVLQSGA